MELLESKEKKSIQGRNLAELTPLEEVKLCCQLLEKVNGISSEELLLRQLERLEEIHITPEILFETKVGKSMNDFSKRLSTDKPQAATKARQLWSKWKSDWKRARDEELKKQETQETQATQQSQKDSQGSEKQSEKVSESKQVKVPPTERCLAIDASKLQCKHRRHQPRFLCGLHQRMLDQNGQLEHGWIADSDAPNGAPQQSTSASYRDRCRFRATAGGCGGRCTWEPWSSWTSIGSCHSDENEQTGGRYTADDWTGRC